MSDDDELRAELTARLDQLHASLKEKDTAKTEQILTELAVSHPEAAAELAAQAIRPDTT